MKKIISLLFVLSLFLLAGCNKTYTLENGTYYDKNNMYNGSSLERISLKEENKVKKIIFSDSIKELESIKEYILNNGFKIVFVINSSGMNKSAYFEIISSLNKLGLSLYDFVIRDELGNYYNIENVDEAFTTINSGFKRIFKRD